MVAHGSLAADGTFVADEVLAKHDEKYMPPEVARSLKRRHGESRAEDPMRPRRTPADAAHSAPPATGSSTRAA